MTEYFQSFLMNSGLSDESSVHLSNAMTAVVVVIVSILAYLIFKKIIVRILHAIILKSKSDLDDVLIKNKVLETAARIIPAAVIHVAAMQFPDYHIWIERIAFCFIIFIIVQTIDKLLDAIDDIYHRYEISKLRPIKGYLQVVKILVYIVGIIVIISVLIDRSPWLLLSGIGAATAVLLLVFQNSIQGLVAGIQLTANDMVRIGDWIEMSKHDANGEVIEVSLHTVKVQNWNMTISTIPTHSLITDSFKNWRGMREAGGRRIKRALYIDMKYIRFCTDEMLQRYKKIQYMQEYLEGKEKELAAYHNEHHIDPSHIGNGRHLTNIGSFRAYIERYLNKHPKIHQGMIKLVRQLEPTDKGLPIEIYVFTNTTAWNDYESIQADIFDHIIAILPAFDLRIFQNPSGNDLAEVLAARREQPESESKIQ